MPFLSSQGNFKPGRGFFAAGTVPGAPTFTNPATAATEGQGQLPVTFIPPAFDGRIGDNWI